MRAAVSVALLMLATSALAADPVKVIPPQQRSLGSENGRYVFGQISEYRRDQYMLDTQTGRLWKIVLRKGKNAEGADAAGDGFEVLDWVPYLDTDGKMSVLPK